MRRFQHSVVAMVAMLLAGQIIFQQSVVQRGFAQQGVARQGSKSVVIHAGHVLDVKTGKLLADQTVVIEDGKIVSLQAASDARANANAVRIELPNATILPGLIDAHTHLTMDPMFGYAELGISVPREALI